MIIGIDIRVLGNATKSGVEEYTENLLAHMIPLNKDVKYKLFYSSARAKLNTYSWLSLPNVEVHEYRISNRILFTSANLFNRPHIDTMMGGVDVFFSPHFFITSLSPRCEHVITYHDLSYVRFSEFFSLRKRLWHTLEMRPGHQSRFSDKIIAVSNSTKSDLVNLYKLDPVRIEVIHSGISPTIRRPADNLLEEFRKRHNLPNNFILFLGKMEPRKNIQGFIRAFNILKGDDSFSDLHLVLAGSKGWLYEDIFKEIKNSKFKDKIIFIEHVLDEDRSYYYSLANIFIYPSFFEGFGFPPLEAMACGTPVISSNSSSLPEVVARGGLMVDPHNINEIAFAMALILNNRSLKSKLAYEGLGRIKLFDWQHTAEKTLSFLLK